MWSEEKQKEADIREAKAELIKLMAIKELVKDNTLALMIKISGIEIGLCKNDTILPAIEHQIQEINKFLSGEPNDWE